MARYIINSAGEKVEFNKKKFTDSLKKAGAESSLINAVYEEICTIPDLTSTGQIYKYALRYLHKNDKSVAAHYNLKRAIMELGPDGYPFEQFIGHVLRLNGYTVKTNQTLKGQCVTHEVDVVAEKDNRKIFIECKFHNQPGAKSSVKVIMYINSRFMDLINGIKKRAKTHKHYEMWVVTNTKFTLDALAFGNCYGLNLVSWQNPQGESLPDLINIAQAHPITTLTSLTAEQKKFLVHNGIVLCRQLHHSDELLKKAGISEARIATIKEQIKGAENLTQK